MKTQKVLVALSMCRCPVDARRLCCEGKSGGSAALAIPESAKQNLVVSIKGENQVEQNPDWNLLKRDWDNALQVESVKPASMSRQAPR
jgi:hypothetical protein